MIQFIKISPSEIDKLPSLAITYLNDAIKRTPATTSRLDITLDIAKKGYGNIYLVYNDGDLIGALYLLVYSTPKGKVVGITLMGGKNLKKWKDDCYKFAIEFSKLAGAKKICVIGRKGWGKKYPMAKIIGHIYEYIIP